MPRSSPLTSALSAAALAAALLLSCIPAVHAQDDPPPPLSEQELIEAGRVIVITDITGKKANDLQESFLDAFAASPKHVVFDDDGFLENAAVMGHTDPRPWQDSATLAAIASQEAIDAVVVADLTRASGVHTLTVEVYDGATGKLAGLFSVDIGRRRQLSDQAAAELLEQAEPLFQKTGHALKAFREKPEPVTIRVQSTPPGADVRRQGQSIGTTPLEISLDPGSGETWEVHPADPEQPHKTLSVDLSTSSDYTVDLTPTTPTAPTAPTTLAAGNGGALPLFDIGVGVHLTARALTVEVAEGTGLQYDSGLYPVIRADIAAFPLTLATSNDWVAGLGLAVNFGFGQLKASLPHSIQDGLLPESSTCGHATETVIECPVTHLQFGGGLRWRALLQSIADPQQADVVRRDPNGMAVGARVEYTSLAFDIDPNPAYEGHGYQGMLIGASFSSPLGLPELRGGVAFDFIPVFTYGDGDMIADWGLTASGWGLSAGLDLSYDLWEGIYLLVGYDLSYFSTSYDGVICDDPRCDGVRSGSVASDLFHQTLFQAGWRLD